MWPQGPNPLTSKDIRKMKQLTCGAKTKSSSQVKFDAAHSVAINGVISEGLVITSSNSGYEVSEAIKSQLFYTIGQFNGVNSVADLSRNEISVGEIVEIEGSEPKMYEVHYAAKLFIAWQRTRYIPENYELILPKNLDYMAERAFYNRYSKNCIDWSAHDLSVGIFWYYYRPLNCNIANHENELVAKFNIKLTLSDENTDGKYPEYDKIWEDELLSVTAIFGKYEHGATSSYDAGIDSYNQFFRDMVNAYGRPLQKNGEPLRFRSPGVKNSNLELIFRTKLGVIDLNMILVDGITSVDENFRNHYNERTKVSDLISYNGHSGLGANIRALANMGEFVKGKYQIFLINGCDTFAYVDDSLKKAHHKVNPDEGPSKYFDLITNAMPSYFHSNSRSNMTLIKSMLGQQKTYREILAGFDTAQRANVTGEEDNNWPESF